MSESFSEAGSLRTVTKLSLLLAGGVFNFTISAEKTEVLSDVVGVVREVGNIVFKLGALYTGYKLLKPLIDHAVREGLGGDRDDQEGQDPRPGSLHVLLYCKTDERFLEVLKDYDSGNMRERLENEFSKIKEIKIYGLKVEITNMDEVQATKEKIRKRLLFVSDVDVTTSGSTENVEVKESGLDGDLQKQHETDRHQLEISDEPIKPKPVPKKRIRLSSTPKAQERIQFNYEKAYLDEVRTVIVSGIWSETTDETLEMFFENTRRSGGGEIEKLERRSPDFANITFVSAEVAAEVLRNKALELEGYLLQLKEKTPELILPPDRKKLYVENMNPKTLKAGLQLYLEEVTKMDVLDVQFGDNNNALVTLDDEPDMTIVQARSGIRPLDGADLKISNPPVCNSVLITGLNKNTTKQTIEMYFKNEKNGGGKIYGDIIHQNDRGKSVVSFCDPSVLESLIRREHTLNRSVLFVQPHYQFMETIEEITIRKIEANADIVNHVVKNCENEIRDLFGIDVKETVKENKGELNVPGEMDVVTFFKFQEYIKKFRVKNVLFSKKLLESGKEDLDALISKFSKDNFTLTVEEVSLCVKLVGNERDVDNIYHQVKTAVGECEKGLNVVTEEVPELPEHKLQLLLLHGTDATLKNDFQVDVNIDVQGKNITIKGAQKQVSLASKSAMTKCIHISEESIDLSENEKKFMESGGLDVLNSDLKAKGLKGMVFLSDYKRNKAKVLYFDATTFDEISLFLADNMSEKTFLLDEDSATLLESSKWEEFYDDVTSNTSVKIYTGARSAEISLIGKKSEVGSTYQKLETFMRRKTIVTQTVPYDEGCTRYLTEYCQKDLNEIGKRLEDYLVAVHTRIQINGTKEGVKEAKVQLEEIVRNIAKGTMCFDKKIMQNYLESDKGKIDLKEIESATRCVIQLATDGGERSALACSTQPQISKLLCNYKTPEKMLLKVYKGDITAHLCDVIVNSANGDLKHVGGVAKSILNVGGKEIQDECDAHVQAKGRLFDGECFSGSPGNLPCKRLIHAVAPRWDSGPPEKVKKIMKVTFLKVLQEAKNYQSIALPAIGSGIFGIPKQVCAEVMIEAAEEFSKRYDDSQLKEIDFVDADYASAQEFVKKFQEKFGEHHGQPSIPGIRPDSSSRAREIKRGEPRVAEPASRKPGDQFIITKRNMKISVVIGDLSRYKADVLVNTTGESLQLDLNPCSKALSNEAGPILQAECSKIGKIQVGDIAVTQGGNLLCDEVYHVICVPWNNGEGEQVLRFIITNCLNKCNINGKKSIAFPAIGTGILGFPHDVAAKIFFEETKDFGQKIVNCIIKHVSFVVYNQDAKSVKAFNDALKKQAEWGKDASSSIFRPTSTKMGTNEGDGDEGATRIEVKGNITKESADVIAHLTNPLVGERSPVNTKKLFLEIYAKDSATVNAAKKMIQTIVEKQKKKEKIEDPSIEKLSAKQISEIRQLCARYDLEVTIDKEINRIILNGHTEDISTALNEIWKKIGEAEKEKEKAALYADLAEIVSQGVQWFWVDSSDDDEPVKYEKHTNAMIEKAYSKEEKSVIFVTEDEKFEIVFDKMKEKNLRTNEQTKVIRKDLKAREISVPEYWDPQPRDANGKELTVHVVTLEPRNPNHKEEYKKVSDHFQQTESQPIHQIQRIQNPALYKIYAMKKQSLDAKNGSNEKFLFHGTNPAQVNTINESGLNRSYAGVRGVAFGKGIYFSRDASMSAGYARADPTTNKRYMYYARVAVGEYAVGNSSMLVPPQKGGRSGDSYDSTVNNVGNPTIFVLFYDNQYYPEYLITFS